MKTVLKYGILGGIILAVGLKFLSDHHFPWFVLTIVLFPGGMMFTINEYLMNIQNRQKYSYPFGVFMGLSFALLSILICHVIWLPLIFDFDIMRTIRGIGIFFVKSWPFLIMAACGVPLIYLSNEKPDKEDKEKYHADILDEEL
jgi:hypothetical protein